MPFSNFRVVDPERAIIQVQRYLPATNMLAQTTLRAVLGQHELDEMLSERKKLSTDVQSILDTQTETWGIKVSNVEIRTVELTDNMVRAIAKQAEAERIAAPRSSTPKPSSRPRKPSSTPQRSSRASRPHAAALPADPDGDRRRAEFHHHLPDADRHHQAVLDLQKEPPRRRARTAPIVTRSLKPPRQPWPKTGATLRAATRRAYGLGGSYEERRRPNKLANLGLTLVVLAIAALAMGYLLANLHSDTHWPSSFRTQGAAPREPPSMTG